jgi:nicotinate dehydrogenase subunit B
MSGGLSRRAFLGGSGALIVAFGIPAGARAQTATPPDKRSLYSSLDAWLAVGRDGRVTVFSGKVELGTGVETALAQIVADELDVPAGRVGMVLGDTARTPDQGLTTGSKTIQQGGPQLRQAAAEARQALLALASARLGAPVDRLIVRDGVVSVAGGGSRKMSYGELIGGQCFNRDLSGSVAVKRPEAYRVVGQPVRRVDIPGKVTGAHTYVHDVRVPGMLHGRVVRPPAIGATLASVDESSVRSVRGLVKIVSRGNFLGVVAEREEQVIRAARELKTSWHEPAGGAEKPDVHEVMRATPTSDKVLHSAGDIEPALKGAARTLRATYLTPFQMHASIGPSCAVADVKGDGATIWSGTQGAFGLRDALAELLDLAKDQVRVVWVEASGCYGHNGADDVAGDAALLSQAVGRPVRVQWMRHDEHGWEPKGPAMIMDVRGGLDARGRVVAWDYAVTTPTHSTRPRSHAGNLLAGQLVGLTPSYGLTGGDRNARHTYVFPNDRVTVRWQSASLLRTSAFRGLGGPHNSFANESFMDELAAVAGVDPIEFRLRHLEDPRAIAVLERVARLAHWRARPSPRTGEARAGSATGRGVAYVQYENAHAHVAVVVEAEVNRQSGAVRVARVFVGHDCGLIINPDGVKNQIEGNVLQTISRALKEEVAFTRAGVTGLDWSAYPILTFPEVPDAVEVALVNRPNETAVGAGEPTACPIPAAIANAIFDATGARVRNMPFTPERVRAALG